MLLHNEGKEFEITYDGNSYIVPEGKFHCNSRLGYFIKEKNQQWEEVDVKVIDTSDELIDLKKIVPVKEESKEESKEKKVDKKPELKKTK